MVECKRPKKGDRVARFWMALGRLSPAGSVSEQETTRLISDLDSNEFAVREQATRKLEELGELAEPALRRAIKKPPSLEVRRRSEALLAKVPGARWRVVRAVAVLEHVERPEAHAFLESLAKGHHKPG